jgi:hypothetical protein
MLALAFARALPFFIAALSVAHAQIAVSNLKNIAGGFYTRKCDSADQTDKQTPPQYLASPFRVARKSLLLCGRAPGSRRSQRMSVTRS